MILLFLLLLFSELKSALHGDSLTTVWCGYMNVGRISIYPYIHLSI